jgi:hypothetical protein
MRENCVGYTGAPWGLGSDRSGDSGGCQAYRREISASVGLVFKEAGGGIEIASIKTTAAWEGNALIIGPCSQAGSL